MDSAELNKFAGGAIGALLVFLLLGFVSELLYHGAGHDGEDQVLAFAVEVETDSSGGQEQQGPDWQALLASADAANGESVFNKCQACHALEDGKNQVGPHLYDVVGREIASVSGYSYSDALMSKEGSWGLVELFNFLHNPSGWAPGTKMGFAGLKNDQDKVDLITWLNDVGDSPIEFEVPASPEGGGGEGAEGEKTAEGGGEGSGGGGSDFVSVVANADPAAGEKAFNKCKSCHAVEDGKNQVGPHLYGVVGRKIASVEGYSYSDALMSKEGDWTVEHLNAFLENPQGWAKGTKMSYPGVKGEEERAQLIAYLNQQSDQPMELAASGGGEGGESSGSGEGQAAESGSGDEGQSSEGGGEGQAAEGGSGDEGQSSEGGGEGQAAEGSGDGSGGGQAMAAAETGQQGGSGNDAQQSGDSSSGEGQQAEGGSDEGQQAEGGASGSGSGDGEQQAAASGEQSGNAEQANSSGGDGASGGGMFASADPAAGEKIFRRCSACHAVEDGKNQVGPHLYGVVGRKIASVEGYSYSDALMSKDGAWDPQTLDAFLENPQGWAKGTKMSYPGLKKPEERASVIAYLNQQSDQPIQLGAGGGGQQGSGGEQTQSEGQQGQSGEQQAAAEGGQSGASQSGDQQAQSGDQQNQSEGQQAQSGDQQNQSEGQQGQSEGQQSQSEGQQGQSGEQQAAASSGSEGSGGQTSSGNNQASSGGEGSSGQASSSGSGEASGEQGSPEGEQAGGGQAGGGQAEGEQAASDEQQAEGGQQSSSDGQQAAASGGSGVAAMLASADPATGEKVFRKCQACHAAEKGKNQVGPYLYNVVGREIASVESYSYSDALKSKDGKWTPENLDAFLENPQGWAKGTKMSYPGLKKPEDRANVIAWLNQQSDEPMDLAAAGSGSGGAQQGQGQQAESAAGGSESQQASAESGTEAQSGDQQQAASGQQDQQTAASQQQAQQQSGEEAQGAEAQQQDQQSQQAAAQQSEGSGSGDGQMQMAAASTDQSGGQQAKAGVDPQNGQKIFRKCSACHSLKEGEHKVGPSLHGVVGRDIASLARFDYSSTLASKSGSWDKQTLNAYLHSPTTWAPGTRMAFAGIASEKDRVDLIAYLDQAAAPSKQADGATDQAAE